MGVGCAPVFGVPESTPRSMPFSLTIRLNTSPTERTPWPGFQSYLPDITRASPANLSESVPASFTKAACIPAGCACASEPASRLQHHLAARLRRPPDSCALGDALAHGTICSEKTSVCRKSDKRRPKRDKRSELAVEGQL